MRNQNRTQRRAFNGWRAASLLFAVVGLVLCGLSLIDVTPGFGMVQMIQLLLGVSALTLAAFMQIYDRRPTGTPRSLQADIGIRLAATGLVFAYVSGLSDLIGIGTHVEPAFSRPAVGWLQLSGLALGIFSIGIGLLLYYTSRGARTTSLLGFLIREDEKEDIRRRTNF